jgi:hypothetical protein
LREVARERGTYVSSDLEQCQAKGRTTGYYIHCELPNNKWQISAERKREKRSLEAFVWLVCPPHPQETSFGTKKQKKQKIQGMKNKNTI